MNDVLTTEEREGFERVFGVEACRRLAHSTQDYYSTHGDYIVPLARLLNDARAQLAAKTEQLKDAEGLLDDARAGDVDDHTRHEIDAHFAKYGSENDG